MPNAEPPPVLIAEGVGHVTRYFLREVGSVFWLIANTIEETFERIQRGRVPFSATSFFRHTERVGVDSVPLVGLVSFFLGLTMALLTGYQFQRFGTERLVPGLVAIAFTRELGPLDHWHHAGGADRRGVYSGARHDAGFRRSRGDRSHGHRTVALSGRPTNARPGLADAVSLHGFEHGGDIRQQPGLQSLISALPFLTFSTW